MTFATYLQAKFILGKCLFNFTFTYVAYLYSLVLGIAPAFSKRLYLTTKYAMIRRCPQLLMLLRSPDPVSYQIPHIH
jgi:hypothetical protein